jgi:hypothetical protein
VVGIEYWVYEVDPFWPEQLTVMRGHRAVPLSARKVLFNSLQTGNGWGVDGVGYNFRHEIQLAREPSLPKSGQRYEVAHQLTLLKGCRTGVRFILRCAEPEKPLPGPPPRGREHDGA